MWAFRFRTETRHDLSFLVGMYCKGFKFFCRGNVAFAIKRSRFFFTDALVCMLNVWACISGPHTMLMLHSALQCCAPFLECIQHSVHSKSLALKCTRHSVQLT